ncbi:glycosyltransferase family 90 protein [Myriangium duriaei CBS 260.36]|uniref:Glycosyltransferase family 90 protein n=1 Tax=Myriangium duriaei CBS 260.36 TaxID=1168546 RepID=A0A9P4MBL5_9PEZI|nr:glycosyltransferase family 90 protein [Myriangium duriaei CBS 260.36]
MAVAGRRPRSSVLLTFILILLGLYWLTSRDDSRSSRWIKHPKSTEHPIKLLHEEATQRFEQMIARQSKTFDEAVTEYKRRYKRDPPQGFDKWFEMARVKNSPIIDDFDMILESLEPWLKMKPTTINQLFERAAKGPNLMTIGAHKGHLITAHDNWMGVYMRELLKDVAAELPDFELLMNPLDEPRVLLTKRGDTEIIHWTDESKVSSWDRVEAPCRYRRSGQVPKQIESNVNTDGIPFVANRWAAMDICLNPQFEVQHGFLIAPYSLFTTNSPVPMLSQAKPTTFADILMPSMWYFEHHKANLFKVDATWEEKKTALYWAGSTTGGVMRDNLPGEEERLSHRHRFIKATKQLGRQAYSFLTRQPRTNYWVTYQSNEVMSQLYDTKFTSLVQCEGAHCATANKTYQVTGREESNMAYKYKFLMDLDGNSFSGRFYNFLQSRSCPLKQTIFREWHDERLMPWVHYIPISLGLEDLPETMRYLATTEEGSQIAQKVAKNGREWHDKFLRKDDAAIYLYRLFLEFARLVNPEGKK